MRGMTARAGRARVATAGAGPFPSDVPSRIGWRGAWAAYLEPRLITIFLLGFACGLPLLLTASTLAIWMTERGVSLTGVGLFAMVGTPYTVKFLWAPAVDRLPIPGLTRWLGRRRGWLLVIQGCLMGAIVVLGLSRPGEAPWWTAAAALLVAFCSATQDIVVDAYRIESLDEHQQGAGAAVYQFGYRLAMLVSGAGALLLAEYVAWPRVYGAMAALLLVGVAATLMSHEPGGASEPGGRARLGASVVEPLAEFLRRQGLRTAAWVLAFILLYKLGDAFAGVMANPFYIQTGFSKTEIAAVTKVFGLVATLAGVFLGGAMVSRHGVMRALLVCGIFQMASNLMFVVQAMIGHDVRLLVFTIGIENLTGGMGSAAFVAYLSLLCNVAYTATQYALFSSLTAVGRTLLSSASGILADHVDWVAFFLVSTVLAVPGLLTLAWMMRRFPAAGRPAASAP